MRKRILIIKTGNTVNSLLDRGEDFEDWFIAESARVPEEFLVRSLHKNEPLDDLNTIAGIIITGSPAYVTDEASWNFVGADYLRKAHELEIPILGVCYGHQLIAWAFGGKVDFHPKGREIGTVAIELTAAAKGDQLFVGLPEEFFVQVSHQQSVTGLPVNAVRLAANSFEPNQAYRLGSSTWGIQFHPEFSAEIVKEYICARKDAIESEGLKSQSLLEKLQATPYSVNLLRRFCQLALGN
jgi:GMP synthase (glutamine-hydrolysing)